MSEIKKLQGFAALSPEQRSEIARKGGQTAQARGTAHRFTPAEAQVAGRQGGAKVSADRAHMAAIGRKGGLARGAVYYSNARPAAIDDEPTVKVAG